jgi:hypothetical protein
MDYNFTLALILLHIQPPHDNVQQQTTYNLQKKISNVFNLHILTN